MRFKSNRCETSLKTKVDGREFFVVFNVQKAAKNTFGKRRQKFKRKNKKRIDKTE